MKLKEARAGKFLSIRELAQEAGVGASTIYAIESGRELPTLRSARKLAQTLQVEPMDVDEFRAAWERTLQGKSRRRLAVD